MKPHIFSAINAFTMLAVGAWGWKMGTSPTALIPVLLGGLLLPLNNGIRHESKVVSHVAVVITLFAIFGLGMALKGAIGRENSGQIMRVSIMLFTAILAMIAFVKSFIDAKKRRAKT